MRARHALDPWLDTPARHAHARRVGDLSHAAGHCLHQRTGGAADGSARGRCQANHGARLVPVLSSLAQSGVGVLLIEQFAHVALGLANSAYVLEGGRIRHQGPAQQLRENPDLLRSAYLLRT